MDLRSQTVVKDHHQTNSEQNTAEEYNTTGWSDTERDKEGDDVMHDSTYEPLMIFSKGMEDLMNREGRKRAKRSCTLFSK